MLRKDLELLSVLPSLCDAIKAFLTERGLKGLGKIGVFRDREASDAEVLVLEYGIEGKTYSEVLKLWDDACIEASNNFPPEILKKVVIVFDEL